MPRIALVHLVAVARCLIKVHETGRWAHINVKLLHLILTYFVKRRKVYKDAVPKMSILVGVSAVENVNKTIAR